MISFDLGDWHPVLLHFPIVLIWTALVYDLLGLIWKYRTYPAGHWIVIAAALLAVPTVITGLLAAGDFAGHPLVATHRNFALATLAYTMLHAAYRMRLLLLKKASPSILLVILTLINVVLVSVTADFGGAIAFGKKPTETSSGK